MLKSQMTICQNTKKAVDKMKITRICWNVIIICLNDKMLIIHYKMLKIHYKNAKIFKYQDVKSTNCCYYYCPFFILTSYFTTIFKMPNVTFAVMCLVCAIDINFNRNQNNKDLVLTQNGQVTVPPFTFHCSMCWWFLSHDGQDYTRRNLNFYKLSIFKISYLWWLSNRFTVQRLQYTKSMLESTFTITITIPQSFFLRVGLLRYSHEVEEGNKEMWMKRMTQE